MRRLTDWMTGVLVAGTMGGLVGCASHGRGANCADQCALPSQQVVKTQAAAPAMAVASLEQNAKAFEDKKDWPQARSEYEKLLAAQPQHATAAHRLGLVCVRQGDMAAARKAFEQALVTNPNNATLLNDYGFCCMATKDYAQAETVLRKAITLDPKHALTQKNLGIVLVHSGRTAEALAELKKSMSEPHAQFEVGKVLAKKGSYKEALALCQDAYGADNRLVQARKEIESIKVKMAEMKELAVAQHAPAAGAQDRTAPVVLTSRTESVPADRGDDGLPEPYVGLAGSVEAPAPPEVQSVAAKPIWKSAAAVVETAINAKDEVPTTDAAALDPFLEVAVEAVASEAKAVPQGLTLAECCLVTLRDEQRIATANPVFETVFEGKKYRFSSREAQVKFEESPAQYLPVAGGGDVVSFIDHEQAEEGLLKYSTWYKDRLYLFTSAENLLHFQASPRDYAIASR